MDEAGVVTGTGTIVVPEEPVGVLSEAGGNCVDTLPRDPVAIGEPVGEPLAVGEVVAITDTNEADSLARMLEKAEESWDDSAESVAVAAMLDNSELRDADKLERTAETAAVTDEETLEVCVEPVLLASDTIDDSADEIACEACDTAEDTRLETGSELEPVDDVATTDKGLDPVATVVTGAEVPEAAVGAMTTELPEGLSEEPETVVLDKDAPVNMVIGDVDEDAVAEEVPAPRGMLVDAGTGTLVTIDRPTVV
ncbi:hypothetical protein LTR66_003364 [Elasticomyces elasticus]|nr:hypothetical protein LTR66_003364 [Elasticomyces elasticus]